MQGWGWEGSGRVVGALFVEGASGFVSKEAFREYGKGSFLQRRVSSLYEPTMSVKLGRFAASLQKRFAACRRPCLIDPCYSTTEASPGVWSMRGTDKSLISKCPGPPGLLNRVGGMPRKR